jgi:hypothetical protein
MTPAVPTWTWVPRTLCVSLAGGLLAAASLKIPPAFRGTISSAWGWVGFGEVLLAVPLLIPKFSAFGIALLQGVLVGSGLATLYVVLTGGACTTCKCLGARPITHAQALAVQGVALGLCLAASRIQRRMAASFADARQS